MKNKIVSGAQARNKIYVRVIHLCQVSRCHHPNNRRTVGTKEPLDECERGEWKTRLKLNIQKPKIMAFGHIISKRKWNQ